MAWSDYLNTFLFGVYPYICLSVLLLGSLVRFDREPYTWKSDSSQLLRRGQLRIGSNLFHVGVIVVVLGHFVGFLTPEWAIDWAISPAQHQLLAMVAGGIAGLIAIVGLTMLIQRRVSEPRLRLNSRKLDFTVLVMLWLQLLLGLITVPLSAQHMDGEMFARLSHYVSGIVTFNAGAASLMPEVPLVYKIHILLGFTIFLISPFTRMVHIWSGVGSLAYLFRPYQIVRSPARRPRKEARP
ncbi:MAG TPA: respiratory nitrate reductase subunit gamma [Devosiaceae bacterium]|jgi:nitrate reductase gamma subunit|nr:respiratory nitrate reductase subunit gamma [Devosiaceae bacterium]